MKQPTITDLCNLLHEYERLDPIDRGVHALALKIHWLYNQPLKPLSELWKDKEACEEIWAHVHPNADLYDVLMEDYCVEMDGEDESGSVTLVLNSNTCQLSDIIRKLGYDVQPETKTP